MTVHRVDELLRVRRAAMNPPAVLANERRTRRHGPQAHAVFDDIDVERRPRAQTKALANGFWQHQTPSFVDRDLGLAHTIIHGKW